MSKPNFIEIARVLKTYRSGGFRMVDTELRHTNMGTHNVIVQGREQACSASGGNLVRTDRNMLMETVARFNYFTAHTIALNNGHLNAFRLIRKGAP